MAPGRCIGRRTMEVGTTVRWLFSIALLIALAPESAQAARLVVGEEYSSIKAAIAAAAAGDTILITAGHYAEGPIHVKKRLTIVGQGNPVVDGAGQTEVFVVEADSVVIRKIVVQRAGVSFMQDNAAIRLEKVQHCVVDSCILLDNFFGIYAAESAFCIIQNNTLIAHSVREAVSGNGIHLWYCKGMIIRNNRIRGHRDGIYFEFVQSSLIEHNLSEQNLRYGLHFMFSDSCQYRWNTFRRNGAGVAVMYTRRVLMERNVFAYNWGPSSYGLLLKEISDSRIRFNRFIRNTVGIHSEGSSRIEIDSNLFQQNGWAMIVMANSEGLYIHHNSFIGNSFDVSTNSRQNFNRFAYNFWDQYKGYDLDGDGIGDVPYHPVRLFSLLVQQNPPLLILLRGFLIDLLEIAEQVFPVLTPETLVDRYPLLQKVVF